MSRTRDLGKIISGNFDVPAASLDNVTRSNISDLGTGALSNRNLIINGAMQVAQRGTSATTFSYGTVDRFKPSEGSTSSLAITQTQDTNAPSGFSNSLKITVTTAETMSGSKQLAVFHAMEAQNLQQLGYGTSDAQSVTVSFWVKSSVTGTYCLSLYENDDNRNIGATYTINSANTWEYKTITFPPDTVGVIDNNNGGGLETYFFLSCGPDRKTTDNTSWATWSAARFGYGQVADVAGTTNATWQITGVQLEVGDTATSFEHRSYGQELALCQRYYFKRSDDSGPIGSGIWYANNQILAHFAFPQDMRAAPSIATGSGGFASCYTTGSAIRSLGHVGFDNIKNYAARINLTTSSNGVAGDGTYLQFHGSDSISVDAEL